MKVVFCQRNIKSLGGNFRSFRMIVTGLDAQYREPLKLKKKKHV